MADDVTPDERQAGFIGLELLRDQDLGVARTMITHLLEEMVVSRLDRHESMLNAMMTQRQPSHSPEKAERISLAAPCSEKPPAPRSQLAPQTQLDECDERAAVTSASEPCVLEPVSPVSPTSLQSSAESHESRREDTETAHRKGSKRASNTSARRWSLRSSSSNSLSSFISVNAAHMSSAIYHSTMSSSEGREENEENGPKGIRARLRTILKKQAWDFCVMTLIMSNVILIGVHVNMEATMNDSEIPAAFEVANFVYTILFSVELLVRFAAEGFAMFFCSGPNLHWNWFDGFLVGSALLELAIKATHDEGSSVNLQHARIFRILRITRVFRVLRIARLLKYLRALRFLIYSIMITLKSLAWALLLLVLIFYGFGVAFTQAVADFCKPSLQFDAVLPEACGDPMLAHHWGSLPSSMATLFKSISAGINWEQAVNPLEEVGSLWVFGFFCYVCFSYFAVLNVVTAVFCQSAIDSASADVELASMQSQALRNSFNVYLRKLFGMVDRDGSHDITLDEFEGLLREPQMKACFTALDIEVQDAWSVFKILDANRDGKIDAEEFVNGINNLRGNAKSSQMAQLRYELSNTAYTVSQLSRDTKHKLSALNKGSRSL
eukprot:TRINITY_DN8198_c0_g4_i1.p1 TRINITY_DN8198_c0_g4~~TRINITY_DN8198_c0_g4_i1.p1  ORF type:complete len:628 (-),score=99.17 TRINITY_DN8198_c0_g4_i1:57-1883(-)